MDEPTGTIWRPCEPPEKQSDLGGSSIGNEDNYDAIVPTDRLKQQQQGIKL
ncbi:hypothetical protein HPP92_008879 [Vanilla planifolia]|uniref:Uncharacterized protein n=1 Tax=Vanilla planifolia TaxID=51239 RepID=A0A835RBA2_VANPL|nr:hypothetical protein HPP92_008879 [Vanilla planifolia]